MTTRSVLFTSIAAAACVAAYMAAGCGNGQPGEGGGTTANADLKGSISVDGSSTVAPIMEAVAEEFQKVNSGVKPTVATSGTGGGFKKFINGEIDIANASRPIEEDEVA